MNADLLAGSVVASLLLLGGCESASATSIKGINRAVNSDGFNQSEIFRVHAKAEQNIEGLYLIDDPCSDPCGDVTSFEIDGSISNRPEVRLFGQNLKRQLEKPDLMLTVDVQVTPISIIHKQLSDGRYRNFVTALKIVGVDKQKIQ